jgi:hypothetical protein
MNDRAAVFAKRDYRAGEEVTEKYGVWSDADTLLSAGYVRGFSGFGATVELGATFGEENDGEVSGKVSCVAVSLGASSFAGADAEPELALRRAADALKDHGFEVPWRACLSPAMRGTRDAKRVAKWASIVAENSLGDGKEKDARGDDDDDDAKRRAGGARGAAALLRVLDRRLSLYPTSLEEDEDALRMYREQVERAVARIRELEEADGDAGTTTEDDDVADTKRELTVARRAALATALRAREKRALAATRASIAGDAGGDIFIWADGVPPGGGNAAADGKDEL